MNRDNRTDNPAAHYASPNDIVVDNALPPDQKIRALRSWEFDCRGLMVADDENMRGPRSDRIPDIHTALRELGKDPDALDGTPTKHGRS